VLLLNPTDRDLAANYDTTAAEIRSPAGIRGTPPIYVPGIPELPLAKDEEEREAKPTAKRSRKS
jgi:hypothetical protein